MIETTSAITVAICTYNRHELLEGLIAAILAQDCPGGVRIMVVDNSDDQKAAEDFYEKAELPERVQVFYSTPPNLSRARNLAIKLCKSPYLAFIDDDATPEPGWLAGLLEGFAAASRVGVVGGPVDLAWPGGTRPDWIPELFDGSFGRLDAGNTPHELASGAYVWGCNFALAIDAASDIPGFPEHLGRAGGVTLMSAEELEVQNAARAAGWSVRYAPAARVRHRVHPERLSRNWMRARMAWGTVSEALLESAPPDRERALSDLRALSLQLEIAPAMHRLFADAPAATFDAQLHWIRALILVLLTIKDAPETALTTLCEPEETSRLRETVRRLQLENESLRGNSKLLAGPSSPALGARLRRAWLNLIARD